MIRILAVDDDKGILKLISGALLKEGYEVTAISDPCRIEFSGLKRYDLILLDVMMPEKDGFELCEEIREFADCPILFLTAKTSEADIIKGLGLGADDYLMKPFGIGELRARVAAHLRRENREKKHTVLLRNVRFELQAKKVFCEGVQVELTKSEYTICEYLGLNKGQVFSKERIYEQVFGYDRESDSSAVTEHIKNIRAKFSKAGCIPFLSVILYGFV